MKIRKLKALAPFKGLVISEVGFEEIGCEIKLNFDKRSGPRCPRCQGKLPRSKSGWRTVMDCPMAHRPFSK